MKGGFGHQERMARPELWLLNHKSETRVLRESRLDSIGLVTDDDRKRLRSDRLGGAKDVTDHRRPADAVQDFRAGRFEACAFAGSENDDVNVGHPDRQLSV